MPLRVIRPPPRPLLIYDGDCGFCRAWIARWKAITGDRVDYEPARTASARFPEIPAERYAGAVQFIDTDGVVVGGAEAVFRTLATVPGRRWTLGAYRRIPGVAPLTEAAYRFIAARRPLFARITGLLWGASVEPASFEVSHGFFLRLLGFIYLAAFLSLWTQIDGLFGSRGIQPAAEYLEQAKSAGASFHQIPTLFWFNASDAALNAGAAAGAALAVLLIAGIAPVPVLIALWALYLSFQSVGDPFLAFQWDILLLEIGVLAVFLAPLRLLPRRGPPSPPSRLAVFLVHALLFKLMFLSGMVKRLSGDPMWRDWTALNVHYETQPLPTFLGWYAHQLPAGFQTASVGAMYAIELWIPFLIFGTRRIRRFAFWPLAGFQILILLTGNYCFFNLLTLALCLLLLDDRAWPRRIRERLAPAPTDPSVPRRRWPSWLMAPVAAVLLTLSATDLRGRLDRDWRPPLWLTSLKQATAPWGLTSSYGLFAVMTTERLEIEVEGSRDGTTWLPYTFRYKPGDPARAPGFVAPHQPRLDWQMWFAALGNYRQNPWFVNFCVRLLEGSPPVLGLLETNPFPDAPPAYIRARVYEYRFTDIRERRETGRWWRRTEKGMYLPSISLRK